MPHTIALTGTPGTGKSAVASALAPRVRSIEVADLARSWAVGRPVPGGVEVDLSRLRARVARPRALAGLDLVVGHLAHLLPLRDIVVLRCHPSELERRLRRARRGRPADRRENVVAEATDVILLEAVRPGHRVWEIDTTDRSIRSVATEVARRVRDRGPASYGGIDWLSDPAVTAHLLDRSR